MSKQILKITGKFEIPNPETWDVEYANADLSLNSFSGGKRGRCIQITINQADGKTAYIQLPENEIQIIYFQLKSWLNL